MSGLIGRIFAVLGLGIVTMGGLTILLQNAVEALQDAWGGAPAATIAYLSLAGVPEALGIVCGAYLTTVGFQSLKVLRFL